MSSATITWFGHSCFQITMAGSSVVIDPYSVRSVPGLRLPDLSADAVLVTHDHSDHNATDRVLLSGRELNFSVRVVEGDHGGVRHSRNSILVLEYDDLRLVHMGDQGCPLTRQQVEEIGRPDVLMVPVGGRYTVNAREARQMMQQLNSTVTIPMHYRSDLIGYQVLDTVDAFLEGDLPVERPESDSVKIIPGMKQQIMVPKLVQRI
jgi:L-ascorbate metabolism protein UlaG (beta-lactamase superfamily)